MEEMLIGVLAKGFVTLVEAVVAGGAAGGFLALVRRIQLKAGAKDGTQEHVA